VLTCEGTTFAGRVAASLIRAVGLPELVTRTPEEYEALAVRLATHADELAGLNARLRAHRATAPIFDTDRFRRHLEAAFVQMWERHLAGLSPVDITAPANA
jgi:predicted O-linked N-acetylglucosamine transferase (SPINDLY family)